MTLALRIARLTCGSESRFIPLPSSLQHIRHCSSNNPPPEPKPKPSSKLSRENVRQNVKGYMLSRFFDYVKNYDKVLEKNFPSAVNVYRIFFDGMKEFFSDMKRYLKISRIANDSPKGVRALNRKELELYMQMPRDMIKVAPAIVLSSLPMVGYVAFPLAYMYPRTFLSSHFWTLQQKCEFQQQVLSERLNNNRAVLRSMQALLKGAKKNEQYEEIQTILGLLGSGFHPSVDQLLEAKEVFAKPPYQFNSLSSKHIKLLALMYGLPGGFFRRHRMAELAFIIHYMDLAITREGDVHNMPQESIRYACFIRGLNPCNLSNEEMVEWLRNWVKVSMALKEEHMSLFLHLPIFLGYNHPNNWQLIYGKH
ncbi:LETM1 domain-containing protein 1 isoform X2 [Eupeodes corollae]|uniref:LETM1 domain-containing protein 1 isoform X2 n=1 Tax=Eupeodes corollae TaxID=290404 RepID=UPI00248FBFAA|nr:LETM1 domain-containing protein 1 isoform X2 [Eupeodes corollae]